MRSAGAERLLRTSADICIVIATVCLLVLTIQYSRHERGGSGSAGVVSLKAGEVVQLAGGVSSPQTAILALQVGCHYCEDSMPFYARLVSSSGSLNSHLVFVFPQSVSAAREYLAKYNIRNVDIRQENLGDLRVGVTPTILLVGQNQAVRSVWVGELAQSDQGSVMKALE